MLEIEAASVEAAGSHWLVRWRLRNPDPGLVSVVGAWLPHSQFRSREWPLEPPLDLPPGGEALLDSRVAFHEAAGTVVENGFLILRLSGGARLFARLRVTAGPDGSPEPVCEAVSSGKITPPR
jgi:hypothetical protein